MRKIIQNKYVAGILVFLITGYILSAKKDIQQGIKNTVIIEFIEGKTPSEEQLNLHILNFNLKLEKILRHDEMPLLNHTDLYVYKYEGNPDELKKILEDSLRIRSLRSQKEKYTYDKIEGYQPEVINEHSRERELNSKTEENTEEKILSSKEKKKDSENITTDDVYEDDLSRISSFCLTSKFQVTFKGSEDRTNVLNQYNVRFTKVYTVSECTLYNIETKDIEEAVAVIEKLIKNDFINSVSLDMFGIAELH